MLLTEILTAAIKIGLPVGVASWYIFSKLYLSGRLDKKANRKSLQKDLKNLKQEKKKEGSTKEIYIFNKWMLFGGGFYGLAALWTFFINELKDIVNLIFNFGDFIALMSEGVGQVIVAFIKNQIANILTAFVWFNYWSNNFIIVWLLVAYVGYLIGIKLAKQGAGERYIN